MDKRLIIVFVVLAGLGFLYLALSNESDSDTEGEDTSAVVAQAAAEDSVLRKYELLEKLSTDGGNDVGFTAEVSNIFATLRSVKMVKAQYYQTDNTERSSGLPAEDRGNIPERYYAEGQLELISTWDPKRYPFQAGFDRSGSDKKSLTDVEVTRVLRDVISKATVDPNRPLDLKVPEDHADLLSAIPTIQKGDFVQVVSTEGPATKLIPIVKVKDEATLELGEKLAEGVEFRIIAKGKFSDLMKRDPRFARVAMDEGKSLTYVWPDPENDDSTLFFERKLTVGEDAPYVVDVEHRLFNFGAVLDPVREHVDVIAFQPKVEGGGLFSGPAPDQRSALCHAGGEVYRGTLAEYLDDKKDEDWSPNGSVSWAGVDSRYFMLAVVPSDQENSYCKILGLPTKPPKPPVGVLGTRLGVRGEKKRLLGADPDSCRPFWLNQDDHKARPVCGE